MNEQKTSLINPDLLTPREVALQLGVSPITVRNWAQKNRLPFITTPGGHRRFKQNEVNAFAHQYMNIQARKLSVLIIEDDIICARFLSVSIQQLNLNIDVAIAQNSFEAGQLISKIRPQLILLDLMMPGMNGLSMCESIKKNKATKDIRVIAITGYPTVDNINAMINAGAEQCLGKPVTVKALTNIILQTINTH